VSERDFRLEIEIENGNGSANATQSENGILKELGVLWDSQCYLGCFRWV